MSSNGSPVTRSEFRSGLAKMRSELLRKCASKKDLGRLDATVSRLASHIARNSADIEDLRRTSATKKDLDAAVSRLASHIARNSADIDDLRRTMATKSDINVLVTMLDGIAADLKVWGDKLIVHDHRLEMLEKGRA